MKSDVISQATKISTLIKANPLVIETLAEFNPHFNKLKNPILRSLLARRVSVSDACRIGGCKVSDFLEKMATIGFEIEAPADQSHTLVRNDAEVSNFITDLKPVELDVRPVLASGDDPLKLILKAAKALKTNECLKIINTFEPIPLIGLLCKQGYRSWTERPETNIVYTWFVRTGDDQMISDPAAPMQAQINTEQEFLNIQGSFAPQKIHTIDVRELEMPLPMVRILEYLPKLMPDEALFVYHKKVPVYLLPELVERGFRYFIQDLPGGKINMLICRS